MTVTDLVSRRRTRTAWVLGGGGNLGSVQVGMLRALADRGEVPDLVVGCSVGALNGLAMATDPSPDGVERLRRIWLGVRGRTSSRPRRSAARGCCSRSPRASTPTMGSGR